MNNGARPQKVAMLTAQQIMQWVSRNGLTVGDRLPSESVMLETYNVGRGTLREALRLLEFQGAIALRPGPGGGPVLLSPDASHLSSTLLLLMQMHGAQYRTVVEVRQELEPITSRLAATRISDDDIERLNGTIERMRAHVEGRESEFFEANKEFHDVIARASGNPLFACFTESLMGIVDGTIIGIDYPPFRRSAIIEAHEHIYETMRERDAAAAEERMREHIDAYARYAEKRFPQVLAQPILWEHSTANA